MARSHRRVLTAVTMLVVTSTRSFVQQAESPPLRKWRALERQVTTDLCNVLGETLVMKWPRAAPLEEFTTTAELLAEAGKRLATETLRNKKCES